MLWQRLLPSRVQWNSHDISVPGVPLQNSKLWSQIKRFFKGRSTVYTSHRPHEGYFFQSSGGVCKLCKLTFSRDEEAEAVSHFEQHHGWVCVHVAPEPESAHEDLYCFSYANPIKDDPESAQSELKE